MSNAIKRAKERYWLEPNNIETQKKYAAYVEGYYRAEKDLELTWEDMMLIHKYIKDATNLHLYKMMEGIEGQRVVYQEVLNRFNK